LENPVVAALVISIIGMPLLFLALALFYGLLSLMTSVIRDSAALPARPAQEETVPGEDTARLQAVALAVAIARARGEQAPGPAGVGVGDGTARGQVSSWWTLHHQRQITAGRNRRRSQ
jgi:Na+-transporting methylmalonyl-CoA/oxaloacetate decarboxylase gamma subunit